MKCNENELWIVVKMCDKIDWKWVMECDENERWNLKKMNGEI